MPPKRECVIKTVKKTEVLTLLCEWESCNDTFIIMKEYMDHITGHLQRYLEYITHGADGGSTAQSDIEFACYWRECSHEPFQDFIHLSRHVYFHCFHTKIKAIGTLCAERNSLAPCMQDAGSRNLIPEMPSGLTCTWEACMLMFNNPEVFYLHVANHCDVYPSGNAIKEGCQCLWDGCGTIVKSKHKLKDHVRSHTQEKLVACPSCGALFCNNTRFYDHIKRQSSGDGQCYQCSHCSKKYATERLLKDHMRHHVNYYQCPFCDMTCPNPSNLQLHFRYRHSNARPYICDQCNHTCKTSGDLIRHQETHRAWIYCDHQGCHFRCHSGTDLNRHSRLQHEGEADTGDSRIRFLCHICHLCYTKGYSLTSHLRKKHKFRWPPGHVKFRYTYHDDGFYKLQTVRYESIELTQQIMASDMVGDPGKVKNTTSPNTSSTDSGDQQSKRPQDIYEDVIINDEEAGEDDETGVNYSYNLDLLGDVALKGSSPGEDKAKKKKRSLKTPVKQPNKRRRVSAPKTDMLKKNLNDSAISGNLEQQILLAGGQTVLVSSNVPVQFAEPVNQDAVNVPVQFAEPASQDAVSLDSVSSVQSEFSGGRELSIGGEFAGLVEDTVQSTASSNSQHSNLQPLVNCEPFAVGHDFNLDTQHTNCSDVSEHSNLQPLMNVDLGSEFVHNIEHTNASSDSGLSEHTNLETLVSMTVGPTPFESYGQDLEHTNASTGSDVSVHSNLQALTNCPTFDGHFHGMTVATPTVQNVESSLQLMENCQVPTSREESHVLSGHPIVTSGQDFLTPEQQLLFAHGDLISAQPILGPGIHETPQELPQSPDEEHHPVAINQDPKPQQDVPNIPPHSSKDITIEQTQAQFQSFMSPVKSRKPRISLEQKVMQLKSAASSSSQRCTVTESLTGTVLQIPESLSDPPEHRTHNSDDSDLDAEINRELQAAVDDLHS